MDSIKQQQRIKNRNDRMKKYMREYRKNNKNTPNIHKNLEKWHDIVGFDNYEFSNHARMRNKTNKKILIPQVSFGGYLHVKLQGEYLYFNNLLRGVKNKKLSTGKNEDNK